MSSGGYVCTTLRFTTKALTLWSTARKTASTGMATASKSRLYMCLHLTHVLLTVTCLYS
jgi:hypothetical protein